MSTLMSNMKKKNAKMVRRHQNQSHDDIPVEVSFDQNNPMNMKVEELFQDSYETICNDLTTEYSTKFQQYDMDPQEFMKMITIDVEEKRRSNSPMFFSPHRFPPQHQYNHSDFYRPFPMQVPYHVPNYSQFQPQNSYEFNTNNRNNNYYNNNIIQQNLMENYFIPDDYEVIDYSNNYQMGNEYLNNQYPYPHNNGMNQNMQERSHNQNQQLNNQRPRQSRGQRPNIVSVFHGYHG